MTPFEVTVLSVTLNAAGIVPSANNRFPPPNVIGYIFSQNASTKCRAFLDRRRGERRLESTLGVVAATVV